MSVIRRNGTGELIYTKHNQHLSKNDPDTPLDKTLVPYLIMAFCAIVDATVFINLFKQISYDSPFMLGVEVAGFLFGFDVVPIYLGIYIRRLNQGLAKGKMILWCALTACAVSVLLNVFLRIATIDSLSPDMSVNNAMFLNSAAPSEPASGVDSTAVALTVFGIGLPLITSLGSFFVSYLTYNPLKIMKNRLEKLIGSKKDDVRQITAIINEYKLNEGFAEDLIHDDDIKFEEMKRMHKAIVLGYCDYVRVRLEEHLANPVALSALSEESGEAILQRLQKELTALYAEYDSDSGKTTKEITPLNVLLHKEA